jgi:hypothetical protein
LGYYVSCFARLQSLETSLITIGDTETMEVGWKDITPPAPGKCPHCAEQRAYVAACKRAARKKIEAPDREKWSQCPQCENYDELKADTGLCPACAVNPDDRRRGTTFALR